MLHGQGVIGTFAGPRDPGTAWIHGHHSLGLIGGWSFVPASAGKYDFKRGSGRLKSDIDLSSLPANFTFSSGGSNWRITVVTWDSRGASGTWNDGKGKGTDEEGSWTASASGPFKEEGPEHSEA